MYSLPDELIITIFDSISLITDKRHFLRVCKKYNSLTKQSFMEYEKNYKIKDFDKIDKYCVEKFTLELCYDGYFENIPFNYIFSNNKVLVKCLSYFGNIKLLVLLKDKDYNLSNVCEFAARNGHLDVLKWARENACDWDVNTCLYAGMNGHLKVLQWLRANGCPWNSDTCAYAALNGHLDVLKWARENGCDWDIWTCANAALNGHLEVLKWARKNGCEWNSWTCTKAAFNGHLEVLKWARENGCDWNSNTCTKAVLNGHLEVLKWARENGCPG